MIPSIFMAGLFLFMATSADTIELATSGEKLGTISHTQTALAGDGGFLLNTHRRLFHWNPEGALVQEIGRPRKDSQPIRWITSFHYDSERGIYWVCELIQKKSLFFDQQGQPLGEGFRIDATGKRHPVFYRQLISVDGDLYAVDLEGIDFWRNPMPRALVEVGFRVVPGEGVLVQARSPRFASLTREHIALNYNFKLHWVVRESFHNNLFVVDQLSPYIRHFVPNARGENGELELQNPTIPMALPGYEPPPPIWDETSKTQEDFERWWHSWSRITGFHTLGEGFLVAYEIPDPQNQRGSLQALQRISRNGKNVGARMVPGGSLMGVSNNRAFILHEGEVGTEFRYWVRVLQF